MKKCGITALDIQTYHAGLNQPTHPSVISFDSPWHGYRYYMAYTPYPFGNGFEENPCLAVSNDLLHWEKPIGLINPIATCEELNCDELKDPHLLYRKDMDRLEIWYLGRKNGTISTASPLHCLRKVSTDGCTWSDYEIMYTFKEDILVSPSVIYDGEYLFWGIRHTKEDIGLYFMRSENGSQWSEPLKCDIPDAALTDMWHGTVIYTGKQYHFVWVGYSGIHRNKIYHAVSTDGCNFSVPSVIVENDVGWDYLYRPCLLKDQQQWYCYYGVIRCDGKWMTSVSHGEKLQELEGITADDLNLAAQNINFLIASTIRLKYHRHLKDILELFTPRLLFLLPILIILRVLNISALVSWLLACCCGAGFAYVRLSSTRPFQRGFYMGTVSACIVAFLNEIISQLNEVLRYFI